MQHVCRAEAFHFSNVVLTERCPRLPLKSPQSAQLLQRCRVFSQHAHPVKRPRLLFDTTIQATMLPPVDPSVTSGNPKFHSLYQDLCTNKLNPDASSALDPKAHKERDILATVSTNDCASNSRACVVQSPFIMALCGLYTLKLCSILTLCRISGPRDWKQSNAT